MKNHKTPKQESPTEAPTTQSQLIELIKSAENKRAGTEGCEWLSGGVDRYLNQKCGKKENTLEHQNCVVSDGEGTVETGDSGCACSGSSGSGHAAKVDLIVLIDTSISMRSVAKLVSDAASDAIKQAGSTCETDLQVTYLGVDGTWLGTNFTTSHRTYLAGLTTATLSTDNPVGQYDPEEGANAIEDLSKYAGWRKGACRAIFYISDEELDSFSPLGDVANELAATNAAIAAANLNNVTVFAHHLTYQNRGASVIANYNSLCSSTGGSAFFSATPTAEEYVNLLSKVICSACGSKCKEAEFPIIKPCISISWGDSKCDCLETDDVEVLCITVCNCYSNLTFSDLSIEAIIVTNSSGNPVPSLPDGTPSVQILPVGPLCFGDIPPCKDGKAGCVSREVVLWTRGAKGGHYQLSLFGVCYDITNHYGYAECFDLTLCQD